MSESSASASSSETTATSGRAGNSGGWVSLIGLSPSVYTTGDVAIGPTTATALEYGTSSSYSRDERSSAYKGTRTRGGGVDGFCWRGRGRAMVWDKSAVFATATEADGWRDEGKSGHGPGELVDGVDICVRVSGSAVVFFYGRNVLETACPTWFNLRVGWCGVHIVVIVLVFDLVVVVVLILFVVGIGCGGSVPRLPRSSDHASTVTPAL